MITINLDRAKTISHAIRRQKRSEEFQPLDEVIMKQIPGTDVQAVEAQRQAIRDKYANLQSQIDAAGVSEELLTIVNSIKETL
jgi:hypothetical protein